MSDPFNFTGQPPAVAGAARPITLVEQSSFCLSDAGGDILPDAPHGLFMLDVRMLSCLLLRIDGHAPQPLAVSEDTPFAATFLGRQVTEDIDSGVVVFRRRAVGSGLAERFELRNHRDEPVHLRVCLELGADFADLFEVKERRVHPAGSYSQEFEPTRFRFANDHDGIERTVTVTFSRPAEVRPGLATWTVDLAPRAVWILDLLVDLSVDGEAIEPRVRPGRRWETDERAPHFDPWSEQRVRISTGDNVTNRVIAQGVTDLGALRLVDPDHPDDPVVAAGAPWFMTLFGRDSIITSHMALPAAPAFAAGVLNTLARLQGRRTDPRTEEEPGRILHELRFTRRASHRFADAEPYYGSVDAAPLFVMLLGELHRWGAPEDVVDRLLPHADAALDWIVGPGDRTGSGMLSYERATTGGLLNQGWKDSFDALRHPDGSFPTGPIALSEAQGYAYAAFRARAEIAAHRGDHDTAGRWSVRAAELRRHFHERFTMEDGLPAIALDGDGRRVEAVTSNMGHCLWTGIADGDMADRIATVLAGTTMFTGWGIRTLASDAANYNPVSYHLGSVWPHDTAICIAGMYRTGHIEEAHRVTRGLLDLAAEHGNELPELIAGFTRAELGAPAAYPTSCLPQAWAAAAPLLCLRGILGLEPNLPEGRIDLHPNLPDWMGHVTIQDLRVGPHRMTVRADRGGVEVDPVPDGIEIRVGRAVTSGRASS